MRLLLPAPFGPTTAVKFWRSLKSTVCVPPKDLKPSISNFTMRPRGCSTSMASAMLVHALRVCFEHRCDRRRAGAAPGGCCASVCDLAPLPPFARAHQRARARLSHCVSAYSRSAASSYSAGESRGESMRLYKQRASSRLEPREAALDEIGRPRETPPRAVRRRPEDGWDGSNDKRNQMRLERPRTRLASLCARKSGVEPKLRGLPRRHRRDGYQEMPTHS